MSGMAYSLDLRERVVRAVDRGEETQMQIAERFGVGTTFIKTLLKRRRETGSLAPKPHGGGMPAKYMGAKLKRLERELAKQPDATLEELRDRTCKDASIMAVHRAMKRLNVRRKKNRSGLPNRIVRTFSASGGTGAKRRVTSRRADSSSSTKAERKPT